MRFTPRMYGAFEKSSIGVVAAILASWLLSAFRLLVACGELDGKSLSLCSASGLVQLDYGDCGFRPILEWDSSPALSSLDWSFTLHAEAGEFCLVLPHWFLLTVTVGVALILRWRSRCSMATARGQSEPAGGFPILFEQDDET